MAYNTPRSIPVLGEMVSITADFCWERNVPAGMEYDGFFLAVCGKDRNIEAATPMPFQRLGL